MGDKSASELLHGLLMKKEVGFRFTMQTLKNMAAEAKVDVSEGAITGFIHRAVTHGRVQVTGKDEGNEGRKLHQYEIVDREPWNFKAKGRGSSKGRTHSERHYQEVPVNQNQGKEEQSKISLSDRLFMLAIEIAELEKKSLKDYSADELIAELKTRVK